MGYSLWGHKESDMTERLSLYRAAFTRTGPKWANPPQGRASKLKIPGFGCPTQMGK